MKVFNNVITNGGGTPTPTNPTVIDITDKSSIDLSNNVNNVCYSLYNNDPTSQKFIDINVTATESLYTLYILVNKNGSAINIEININGVKISNVSTNTAFFRILYNGSWRAEQLLPKQS